VLRRLDVVRINDRVLNAAAALQPPELRSLDAIHLATAEQLRPEIAAFVTHGERMAAAGRQSGQRIVQPR
jgi:predicted nucleic acid-binding protein